MKEMATHSGTLAWKIPWMEKTGRLHTVHGVTKSQTPLSDYLSILNNTVLNCMDPLIYLI